ncbi:hypothetical protein K661_02205, partial [Piscirickettsia salmonis LF-89 = ATCC VR-1361]
LSQLSSAKNPNLPRPTHPVLSTPWLAAMVQKGQLRYIKKQNICAQNQLIDKLFGLAA